MKRRLAIVMAILLSGCVGDDYYYLGPYAAPEPQQQTAGCGALPRPTVETAPPPLAVNGPAPISHSSSASAAGQTAEPALATTEANMETGWRRVFP